MAWVLWRYKMGFMALVVLMCLGVVTLLVTSPVTLPVTDFRPVMHHWTSSLGHVTLRPSKSGQVARQQGWKRRTRDMGFPQSPSVASDGADVIIEADDKAAIRLIRKVRVLVWVMTSPKSRDRARSVYRTWGQRVWPDILLFVSSAQDPSLPGTVALKVSEGRGHLTAKTMQAFDYVYKHHFDQADFFMKADNDTYVVMENLRYFLSHLDPDKPFVTGRHFRHKENQVKQNFHSGGAGYVLSRAALALLANRNRTGNPPQCKEDGPMEDVELSRCLEKLGVPILSSTDVRGGSRFHPFPPMMHAVTGMGKNYHNWDANVVRTGPEWINEYPITFHKIKPDDMKLLHFFLYRIRPYGINHKYT